MTNATATQLRRLAQRLREHEEGSTAFANSIGAASWLDHAWDGLAAGDGRWVA